MWWRNCRCYVTGQFMSDHVALLDKSLSTLITHVWPFPRVHFWMSKQLGLFSECATACFALKRFFAGVNPLVVGHFERNKKPFTATFERARVVSFIFVNSSIVIPYLLFILEEFSTLSARYFLLFVCFSVILERYRCKHFQTHGAFHGFWAVKFLFVKLQ